MKNVRRLLMLTAVFVVSCNESSAPNGSKDYDELLGRLASAIEGADVEALGRLHINEPSWIRQSEEFFERTLSELAKSDYELQIVDYLPGADDWKFVSSPAPVKFICAHADDGDVSWSLTLVAGEVAGKIYLCDLTEGLDGEPPDVDVEYAIICSPGEHSLGESTESTFEASWDGERFESHSMEQLAELLSQKLGLAVVDLTSLGGDFSFDLKFRDIDAPSQVKVDLKSVGLDLVATERAEQADARQPTTAPDSKSEGNEKPKPESDGRSQ